MHALPHGGCGSLFPTLDNLQRVRHIQLNLLGSSCVTHKTHKRCLWYNWFMHYFLYKMHITMHYWSFASLCYFINFIWCKSWSCVPLTLFFPTGYAYFSMCYSRTNWSSTVTSNWSSEHFTVGRCPNSECPCPNVGKCKQQYSKYVFKFKPQVLTPKIAFKTVHLQVCLLIIRIQGLKFLWSIPCKNIAPKAGKLPTSRQLVLSHRKADYSVTISIL